MQKPRLCWRFPFLLLLVGFLSSTACTSVSLQHTDIVELKKSLFVLSSSQTPESLNDVEWQPQSLPDFWNESRKGISGTAWYRFSLDKANPPAELSAVYLRRLNMNVAFFFNGTLIGSGGSFDEPMSRNWNRPQYFTVPESLWRQGENIIDIRLKTYPGPHGMLGTLIVGPDRLLAPHYEAAFFMQVSVGEIFSIVAFIFSGCFFVIWMLRRQEKVYGWFFLGMSFWALNNFHLFVKDILFDAFLWEALEQIFLLWSIVLLNICIHRYCQVNRAKIEKILLLTAFALTAILLLINRELFWFVVYGMQASLVLLGMYTFSVVYQTYVVERRIEHLALLSSFVAAIALGGYDWAVHVGILELHQAQLMQFSFPLMLGTFTWLLIARFVTALNETEELNRDLERRVAEKHRALEENYEKLRESENERVLGMERERMMRDMHDGIGGQLMTTLAMVKDPGASKNTIEELLNSSLDDLRNMIDSLDPVVDDLLGVLASMRERLDPRLHSHGIRLVWGIDPAMEYPKLKPKQALQVMRIVQEVFANIIKHAQARLVSVKTESVENASGKYVMIAIIDDGIGMPKKIKLGRGLKNMQARAESIGAQCDFLSSNNGTAVQLMLPI